VGNEGHRVWIKPLEATPLSADEETETLTSVSIEANLNWTGVGGPFDIRRRVCWRTIVMGVVRLPPNF
jgi:hypothetical protein